MHNGSRLVWEAQTLSSRKSASARDASEGTPLRLRHRPLLLSPDAQVRNRASAVSVALSVPGSLVGSVRARPRRSCQPHRVKRKDAHIRTLFDTVRFGRHVTARVVGGLAVGPRFLLSWPSINGRDDL